MEVELSNMHSRVPHLPHDPATPGATAADEGKQIEYVETNAAADSEQPSRAQSTTFPAATPAMRLKARIQFATLCWSLFMAGWNDGTTGPLLPRIQSVYHVRHLLSSWDQSLIQYAAGWLCSGVLDLRLQLRCASESTYFIYVSANPDLQGFVTGAAANVWLTDRLGFGTVRPLSVRPFRHHL